MSATCDMAPSFDMLGYLLTEYGPMLTPSDVASVLRCHPAHARALCQSGQLPAVRIGSRWHIPAVKLAELLEAERG